MGKSLAFDLDELAADVFEITGSGLTATTETLTGGHGMTEIAASSDGSCCCCCGVEEP
jgi:hypothetical protein